MIPLWNDIDGQRNVMESLETIFYSKKIPHAFLFLGPDGIGKHYAAKQFTKLLNSDSEGTSKESVQKRIQNLSEPYLKFVIPLPRGKGEGSDDSPMGKLPSDVVAQINEEIQKKIVNPYHRIDIPNANAIKINSIREIKKYISFQYDDIKYRVILISDAHLMNDESQNALLKSLEEPPPGVVLILTTPYKNRLLPTILSRCGQINFNPLSKDHVKNILIKYFRIEEIIAEKASVFSNGSVTQALELIEGDIENLIERTILILRYSLGGRYHTAYKAIDEIIKDGSGKLLKLIIQMILTWLSDVQKQKLNFSTFSFASHSETLTKFNERFAGVDLNKVFSALENLQNSIDKKVHLNIIGMNVIFELASLSIR